MRTRTHVAALLICGAQMATAQSSDRVSLQAGLGVAFRTESPYVAGATDGLQAAVRIGLPVRTSLRLVGELALVRYADEPLAFPALCPQPGPCLAGLRSLPGLGVTGLAGGVQSRLGRGPLQLILTATAGGYWFYHRQSSFPASALGLRGGLGLGVMIDPRLRIVMEGGGLYFPRGRARDANTRQVGFGLLVN